MARQDIAPQGIQGTQAVDRAATLVSLLVRAPRALTAAEICAETGFPKSTTSRLLSAMERHGLLRRTEDGAWAAGLLFTAYAAGPDAAVDLARVARTVMERLSDLTGETVYLAVARGGGVEQIAQVESTYILGSRDWVGVEVPVHASSLGKVLYAWDVLTVPDGDLERPTPASLPTGAAVREQIPLIRSRGYAVTVDELEVGLTGIAAPVAIDDVVVAALGISGPSSRLRPKVAATGRTVITQAKELSAQLSRDRKEGAA